MKKCLFSTYIKTDDIDIIKEEIELFNTMKRVAFSNVRILGGDKPIKENLSIHMFLKSQFHVSDYFINSARNEGFAAYRSAMEVLALQKENLESRIKQMEKKVKETNKRLEYLEKEKQSLIKRSKTGKEKFASYRGGRESEPSSGVFQVRYKKKTVRYENQYLFEVQYLNPEIKKLKARIRMISQRIEFSRCKLQKVEERIDDHLPSVCFGSKQLFKKQNTVYKNQHEDWKHAMYKGRNPGMTISGRKDATQGNFLFKYDVKTKSLSYRTTQGETIVLKNVTFPYGQELVEQAVLASMNERHAVAWRLEVHGSRVLVKCMVEVFNSQKNYDFSKGCVAFDTNVDHMAYAELDRHGNLLSHHVIPFQLHGLTTEQREQVLSKALEEIFQYAQKAAKPIVMERLEDIKQKPMYQHKKLNEILSSFAYTKVTMLAESKSNKYSIGLVKVNPAFTSQIGKFKYMRHYGISVHEAAAFVIGRRGLGYQDKIPKPMRHLIPDGKKNRHHWSHWSYLMTQLKTYAPGVFYQPIDYAMIPTIKELKQQLN